VKEDRRKKYESSAKRVQLISVRSTPNDDLSEWKKISDWLKESGNGEIKNGIYNLAKKSKII